MAYREPKPVRLTGERAEIWSLIMEQNEYFDGEDGIARGVQDRFLADWQENRPSRLTVTTYPTRTSKSSDLPSYRAAWQAGLREYQNAREYASIRVERRA